MTKIVDEAEVEIKRRDFEVAKYPSKLAAILKKGGIGSASQMLALTDPVIAAQRQADQEALRAAEEAEVRAQRLYEYVSQDEWNTLDNAVREALLNPDPKAIKPLRFNKQDGPSPLSALLGSFVCIGVAWVRRLPRMRSSTWEAQRPSF